MNLQSMDYFKELALEKNFTRAAGKLHITQQTLSSHIAGLEKELGCELIVRSSPLRLTYAGEVFLRYAEEYQKLTVSLRHEFSDIAGQQKGLLRIGTQSTRSEIFMAPILSTFHKVWPQVDVEVILKSSFEKELVSREVDIAISNLRQAPPEILLRDFYMEEIALVIPEDIIEENHLEEKSLRQAVSSGNIGLLSEIPFGLCGPEGISYRAAEELIGHSGFFPHILCRINNIPSLLKLSVDGVCATFAPVSMIRAVLDERDLKKVKLFTLSSRYSFPIYFACCKETYEWSIVREFIRIARSVYPFPAEN